MRAIYDHLPMISGTIIDPSTRKRLVPAADLERSDIWKGRGHMNRAPGAARISIK
jgi:hypothetical protein